jgi:GNAT superfamily N-acetyltransferase
MPTIGDLTIRPVDPWDEHEMDVLQDLYVEAQRAEVPDSRVYSRADSVALLRRTGGPTSYHAFAALAGDTMVGQVWTVAGTTDNVHRGRLWAWVPPRHGRRGVGTALVRHGEQHLIDLGRRTALTQTWIGADGVSGYRPFAERLGYSLAQTHVERRQQLPMDEARLARLEAEATAHTAAYTFHVVVGPIPAELAPGYLGVYNLLDIESPGGDVEHEEGRWTAAELADQDEELSEQGRTRVTVLASDATGVVVAYSCAVTGPADLDDPVVDQRGTLVLREHRGLRLGLAVKCRLTRALQERFPDRTYVRTTNAETNAPMVAINEAMGFEVHSVEGEFQRRLG